MLECVLDVYYMVDCTVVHTAAVAAEGAEKFGTDGERKPVGFTAEVDQLMTESLKLDIYSKIICAL